MAVALGVVSGLLTLSLVVNVGLWRALRATFYLWLDAEAELEARRNGPEVDLLIAEKGETVTRLWLN